MPYDRWAECTFLGLEDREMEKGQVGPGGEETENTAGRREELFHPENKKAWNSWPSKLYDSYRIFELKNGNKSIFK